MSCGVKRVKRGEWVRLMSKPIISRKFLESITVDGIIKELKTAFEITQESCILLNTNNIKLNSSFTIAAVVQEHKIYAGKTRVYLGVQVLVSLSLFTVSITSLYFREPYQFESPALSTHMITLHFFT